MEVKEEEAKICRLCGQTDNICIDVFSEDGTNRLLRIKIHSKINILIDERDLLPKTICVHCVGKLEFVCDFQEECLRTQQLLRDRYNLPPLSDVDELDKSVPGTSTINNNDSDKDLNRARTPQSSLPSQLDQVQEITMEIDKHHHLHDEFRCKSTIDLQNIETPVLTTLQNVPFPQEFTNSQEVLHNSQIVHNASVQLNNNNNNNNHHLQHHHHHQQQQQQQNHHQEILNRDGMRTELIIETRDPLDIDERVLQTNVLQSDYQDLPNSPAIPIIRSIERLMSDENCIESGQQDACVRWLRGRNELEIKCTKTTDITTINDKEQNSLQNEQMNGQRNMIQIATGTLNKLLNVIAETCEVEVSVRESINNDNDNNGGDISFLIELRNKETSTVSVLAKVFPDQGSCLLDPKIMTLLKDQNNHEISEILKIIDAKNQKGKTNIINDDDDDTTETLRNPEELYRMDGEEIHVDDNVEQITVNNQMNYACRLCQKIYERRDKCTVHVKTHLGIKQYHCIVCQAKFVCKSDVMKHIRCSHTNPRPILCPKCPKRFRSKFDLAEHTNVHKGIKPYRCSDCDQTYHHKVSLQMHVKSHLPPQNLACEYCGKVFPYRTRLLSHVGSVHMKNRRNFRCHFCYNLYSSLSVLNDHIKTRHATTFTCETCNKTFKVASKYKAHVHQHTNPKPYVCTVCDNRYASKAFLNEHLLKHQGLRKHVCQKCGARFAQASHLAAHRHVHGEKTHVCSECGKKFNRRDNMKVHLKRHFENDKKSNNSNNSGGIKQEEEEKNEK
ncbi:uncharacterized protein LOC127290035 [Leptopilina boulardi]|uniref:uncharacterized protein LOC127290035 n=1 Tax=Leptopilina boulardi TaxID=63433 RepID=UPI0021F5EE8D|nr:uncharacterized protein LOC127290035 [Leptopilina boulardi]XP_051174361.1 uncharacterized protein LOC127290035 [Leptopilina boulardi]XP_051174362.1 uncharacterized protein LOC127290035 [Leptopilina boulardi]XP_051174364.1 uncharacterized protein LOC127290035 [Leptopilina boulardi]